MSRVVNLQPSNSTGVSSALLSAPPPNFVISSNDQGNGIYTDWDVMWDAIKSTSGPQTITILGEFTLDPDVLSYYEFENRITLQGDNLPLSTDRAILYVSNTVFNNLTKVSDLTIEYAGSDNRTLMILGSNAIVSLHSASVYSNNITCPIYASYNGRVLTVNITGENSTLGTGSIRVYIGNVTVNVYGVNTVFEPDWITDVLPTPSSAMRVYTTQLLTVDRSYTNLAQSPPTFSSNIKGILVFGGDLEGETFAVANGVASSNNYPSSGVNTKHLCPVTFGVLRRIQYITQTSDSSTLVVVYKNGTPTSLLARLSPQKGSVSTSGYTEISLSDEIELNMNTGANPGNGMYYVIYDVITY